jgi:transposase
MNLDLGISNTELAKRFGVSEGTIRYHKRKRLENKGDGRKDRYSAVSQFSTPIEIWIQEQLPTDRPTRNTILSLYRQLYDFHNFRLSYDALRRYIRKHHPEVLEKSYHVRIETPPGKLSQVDWKEKVPVQIGAPGNWVSVNFLIVLLCFSRKPAIEVREKKDAYSFLNAHHQAVKKLGGTTEYYRPDCMKTAVSIWSGRSSEMNEAYADFLKSIGAQGFPARPGTATDKGKVEKKIQDIFRDMNFRRMVFRDLSHVQEYIDTKIAEHCDRTICPATGTTITEAYEYEREFLLQAIDDVPMIPIATMTTKVQKGSLVWFEGNYYQIPQGFIGKRVRCIHTGATIEIYHDGELLETYSYEPGLKGMVRMSRKAAAEENRPMSELVKEWWLEVADRQIDYYHEIIGFRQIPEESFSAVHREAAQ